jgi:SAM-dependent methyltransferase
LTKRAVTTDYGAPQVYERLIAPRYEPIARELVNAAKLRASDAVLELGAGTGLVTRLAAPKVAALTATDLSRGMLVVAGKGNKRRNVSYLVADYSAPLPFLDGSFDVVLSGLTYVQNTPEALTEARRVLKPGGRLALAMWGNGYQETKMLSRARRRALDQPSFPSAAPGRAVRRVRSAGFRTVVRRDFDLAPRFASVDDYIEYRRGFGIPTIWTRAQYERFLAVLREEAERDAARDGSLTLGWTLALITARA